MPTLYLGNKNYSSWSLRPWLVLRWAGLPFEEVVLPLGGEGYGKSQIPAIRAVSPTGRVPVLEVDGTVIADSLAIAEWAAEQVPSLWPEDRLTRARARSLTAEMHSGFFGVRRDLSMNLRRRVRVGSLPEDTRADLDRLFELLRGSPWLFGQRSIADAFYAPVATRLRSYGIELPAPVEAWCTTLFADPDFRAWEAAAEAEPWTIPSTDALWT